MQRSGYYCPVIGPVWLWILKVPGGKMLIFFDGLDMDNFFYKREYLRITPQFLTQTKLKWSCSNWNGKDDEIGLRRMFKVLVVEIVYLYNWTFEFGKNFKLKRYIWEKLVYGWIWKQ